ncbi:MAG TPA: glycoside hydrolase family 43 protein [Pseudonocardia sp.]|jgi:beta-xylosidase
MTAVLAASTAPTIHPTIDRDFPDPTVLNAGGKYYAFSTMSTYNGKVWHVPVQRAASITGKWTPLGDAMPGLPSWVAKNSQGSGDVWAPEVAARSDGSYILYFTARSATQNVQCVGVALAKMPQGPYLSAPKPLVCRAADINTIDPSAFTDTDGKQYLLYSSGKGQTTIWLQQMSVDGITPIGMRRALIQSDRPEEANIVEAPTLVHHEDKYVLFYSGNSYNSGSYFVNYATSESLATAFVKADGQLLTKATLGGKYSNPGGEEFVPGRGHDYLLFHAYATPNQRAMFVVGLRWDDDDNPVLELGGKSAAKRTPGKPSPKED